jgi:hypothetical protein
VNAHPLFSRAAGAALAATFVLGGALVSHAAAAFPAEAAADFTDRHCSTCHNDVDKEGGLDLTSLQFSPGDGANFMTWVKIHDRVQAG